MGSFHSLFSFYFFYDKIIMLWLLLYTLVVGVCLSRKRVRVKCVKRESERMAAHTHTHNNYMHKVEHPSV